MSNFVKENIYLSAYTLGLAIVGYMGYYPVRWVIDKCQKTAKVDQVAEQHLLPAEIPISDHQSKSSHSPKSLTNRVGKLDIPEGKINTGQGEYLVFHNLPNGDKKELTRETFEQVYTILNECTNCYEIIKSKVKEIDPSLEVAFVPRTLYELIFIRECILEDLKQNSICENLSRTMHTLSVEFFNGDQKKFESFQQENKKYLAERECWHLCYFDNFGDNDHPGVREVAYRLNRVVVKTLSPSAEGFTHQELTQYTEKEIDFLKQHYQKGLDEQEKRRKGVKIDSISNCSRSGPTVNFGYESTWGSAKPMGIRSDKDAQIIRDAVVIDCSKTAQKAFILYRGADFQKDGVSCWSDKDKPFSLSYGSSLFAGSLYDGGATAFHHMRKGQNAYAIPVPFDQLNDSPFYIPATNTVAQLFGDGEIFHARTKAWKDFDIKKIGGMNAGANGHKRDHLKSDLNKNELTAQFQRYKSGAILLK